MNATWDSAQEEVGWGLSAQVFISSGTCCVSVWCCHRQLKIGISCLGGVIAPINTYYLLHRHLPIFSSAISWWCSPPSWWKERCFWWGKLETSLSHLGENPGRFYNKAAANLQYNGSSSLVMFFWNLLVLCIISDISFCENSSRIPVNFFWM